MPRVNDYAKVQSWLRGRDLEVLRRGTDFAEVQVVIGGEKRIVFVRYDMLDGVEPGDDESVRLSMHDIVCKLREEGKWPM